MQIGYFENFKKINRTLMKMKDLTVIVPTYNEELFGNSSLSIV